MAIAQGGPTGGDSPGHAAEKAEPPRRGRFVPALVAIGQFVRGTVTLPVWIFRRRRRPIDQITVYSAHPSFFLWLLIATGFISAAIVAARCQPGGADGLGVHLRARCIFWCRCCTTSAPGRCCCGSAFSCSSGWHRNTSNT